MKIAALYCLWDDWDLLNESVRIMSPLVDGVVVIGSNKSNYGEVSLIPEEWAGLHYSWEPDPYKQPSGNERDKRNFGLNKIKELGYTHFIMLDADEAYEPVAFLREKERFLDAKLMGLVCSSQVYFKLPTLTVPDATRVTFIHKLTNRLAFERNTNMPFAYEKGKIFIDPTRQLNIMSGVKWSGITMHHFSYIRKDLKKKVRNSTAAKNLGKSTVFEDYRNAKEGYFCQMYGAVLKKCDNIFNMPEIVDTTI